MSEIIKYPFVLTSESENYDLFPKSLEENPLVLFHGTSMRNFQPIIEEGFKATSTLSSRSFAKNSNYCLTHIAIKRKSIVTPNAATTLDDDVIFVVRFKSLSERGIQVNHSDIHIHDNSIQPEIIGYCVVPKEYKHV